MYRLFCFYETRRMSGNAVCANKRTALHGILILDFIESLILDECP